MIKPGDKLYVIVHAYFHYLCEVVEVLGVRRISARRVVQVHSCERSWTEFFRTGCGKDTKYDIVGEAPDMPYLVAFRWPHAIPEVK